MLYYKGMKNINKNKIVFALFITVFAMFAFAGVVGAEVIASDSFGGGMKNVTYEYDPVIKNPRPAIFSVNPNPITAGSGGTTITIVGDNFVSGAVAKVNNSDRTTSYNSKTRLTVELFASDVSRVGDKVITVYNPGPGGGLSNGIVLSIVSPSSPATTTAVSSGVSAGTSSGSKSTTTTKKVAPVEDTTGEVKGDEDVSDLAAGALFGSGNFFPGSLVGWLLLAILILLLVIIIRRMFGGENKYHETPLKHA